MNDSIKFDPKKLDKLNNPGRFKTLNPNIIWDALNLQNPEILIDIGAGTGFYAKEFSKRLNAGTIYACDNSKVMVEWMQENLKEEKILPITCTEFSVDLPNEIADLVYMINVHHELREPEELLSESYRLLKTGGKIAIIDWKDEEMETGPPLHIRIPGKKIIEHLKSAGFKNIINNEILPLHSFITGQK